ncbi:hypothetical protein FA15DRAFT_697326 [Coprinopsis marcescibilis]|uniref:Ricin B lectin domain-containing protein n=1 Tax=Coprinopsis marcescibilis TaxID=230819 RepID=A0A5C3KI72_COPMA|nr:hypothetical protein FA15DRAFT_697326 [Coprinopsis marcescibilis]
MTLPTGHYYIRSIAQTPHYRVGRFIVEDRSLLPKKIVNGVVGQIPHAWLVEKRDNEYVLRNAGARVGVLEGKLFAFLINEPDQFWRLLPFDKDSFRIVNAADETFGWVLNEGDQEQVEVKKVDGKNPKELWTFSPLED